MPLIKIDFEKEIEDGFKKIMDKRSDNAESGDESQDPKEVTAEVAKDMAKVLATAIDNYIKSGDIYVGPTNVQVICAVPGTPGAVTPIQPAKMK